MALPPLTPDQRAAALEKAAKARKERAEIKNKLKHASTTLPEVLKDGQIDDVVGKMKVSALLESSRRCLSPCPAWVRYAPSRSWSGWASPSRAASEG